MSSVVTIGFLDRTRACIRTEFASPLAEDERRELLVHVALVTARAFASLPPAQQLHLSHRLKAWMTDGFQACPVDLIECDPLVCLPRFVSSFLAPAREYALATNGCRPEPEAVEYFLPMAAASVLRHVAVAYPSPEELLQPALALCAAVAIQPLTVATHFHVAAASLPKVQPLLPKAEPELFQGIPDETAPTSAFPVPSALKHLRERRRSLILSAGVAALLIMGAVQYCSSLTP